MTGRPVKRRALPTDLLAYIVLTLFALISLADQIAPYYGKAETACHIGYVYDGDTIGMICEGQHLRARLQGFDTPETKSPKCQAEKAWGDRATARLRSLAKQPAITLYRHGHDKYGRELVVMLVDGRDVADIMVAEQLAVVYDGGTRRNWCQ